MQNALNPLENGKMWIEKREELKIYLFNT